MEFNVLSAETNKITIEWSHQGSDSEPAQHEVKSFVKGSDGLYIISYTVKQEAYKPEVYALWKEKISNAKLTLVGEK